VEHLSPSGFFQIRFPVDWQQFQDGNILTLVPPWKTGSVTISAFGRSGSKPVPLQSLLSKAFTQALPTTELSEIHLESWSGYVQEFESQEDEGLLHWIAIAAERDNVFVLMTAVELQHVMNEKRSIFEEVLHSVELQPIPRPS